MMGRKNGKRRKRITRKTSPTPNGNAAHHAVSSDGFETEAFVLSRILGKPVTALDMQRFANAMGAILP